MTAFKLNLISIAKKNGGDKYSGDLGDEKPTDIYIPQNISRKSGGKPLSILDFSLSDKELDISYCITLAKKAKSKGGDKYEGDIEGEIFIVYIPQKISRKNGEPTEKIYVSFEIEKVEKLEEKLEEGGKDDIIKKLQEENIQLQEEIEKSKEELEIFMFVA